MDVITPGTLLWQPTSETIENATITGYQQWLLDNKGISFADYNELWNWSIHHLEEFWESVITYFDIHLDGTYEHVLSSRELINARWFEGTSVNYAEHVFSMSRTTDPAIIAKSEVRPDIQTISWSELEHHVAAISSSLRQLGVVAGDRVAAYLPNIPETIIAFLACASIGAIWSSCSPDFGAPSVIARFQQIEPKVLFAIDGYSYNGKIFDRRPLLVELQEAIPSLYATIIVPYAFPDAQLFGETDRIQTLRYTDLLKQDAQLTFATLPFAHPLWILYSSGTTGLPKAIVHSTGGVLLNHVTQGGLQSNIHPGDRSFWFTTTGWVMWNSVVSNLTLGATAVLYDGNPFYPSVDVLWAFAEQSGMTSMGVSPAYLGYIMKSGLSPGKFMIYRRCNRFLVQGHH